MILSIYIQLFILISRFQQSSSSFFLSKYNEVERKSARKKKTTYLRADNTKLSHRNNEIQYEQNFQEKEIYYGKSIGTRWMRDLAEEVDEEEEGENENNEISYDEGNSTKYDGIKEDVEENIYDDDNNKMEKESIENEIEKEQQQQQQQQKENKDREKEKIENVLDNLRKENNNEETINVRLAIALVPGQRHITATGIMNGEEPELSKAIIKTTTQILCEDTDFIIMTGYVNEGGSIHDICRNFNHSSSISSFDDAYDASQTKAISDEKMAEIIRNTEANQSTLLMDLRNVITNVMEHDEIVDGINNENGSSTSNDDTNVSFFLFTLTFRVLNVGWDAIHATIMPPATATTTKVASQSTKIMMSAKSTTTATAEYSLIEKIQHISQMIISNRIKNGSFFKIIISEDNNNADIIAVAAMERQDDDSYIFHIDTTAAHDNISTTAHDNISTTANDNNSTTAHDNNSNNNDDEQQSSSQQPQTSGEFDDDATRSISTIEYIGFLFLGYLLLVCFPSMIWTLYINRRHRKRKHKLQQQEKEKKEEANNKKHLTTNIDNHYDKVALGGMSEYDDIGIDEYMSPHTQFNTMDGRTNNVTTTRATTARRTNNDNFVPNSIVSEDTQSEISGVSSGFNTEDQSISTQSLQNVTSLYRDLVVAL